jgi:hypothetical protein
MERTENAQLRALVEGVRSKTIEECAKIADDQYDEAPAGPPWDGGGREVGWHDACGEIAKAIRAKLSSTVSEPGGGQ